MLGGVLSLWPVASVSEMDWRNSAAGWQGMPSNVIGKFGVLRMMRGGGVD